jgi:hypothetical protein
MYRNKTVFLLSTLFILLSACQPGVSPTAEATSSATHTVTNTPTVSPTFTVSPKPLFNKNCLEIEPSLSQDHGFEGMLMLMGFPSTLNFPVQLWNLKTNEKILLEDENYFPISMAVSPNGEWLALYMIYVDPSPEMNVPLESMVIMNNEGKEYLILPWEYEGFTSIVSWLDEEHLLIVGLDAEWADIVNPFTGQKKRISLVYPDQFPAHFYKLYKKDYRQVRGFFIDPTRTLAVYADPDLEHLVFWDIVADQKIKEIPFVSSMNDFKWSLDGEAFIVSVALSESFDVISGDLFMISRDGEVSQLTDLSRYYTSRYLIDSYSWSPDKQYVAFWIGERTGLPPPDYWDWEFAILDTITGEVTLTCIVSEGDTSLPIWAKNSQQVMITLWPEDGNTNQIVLVDIVREKAVIVIEGAETLGWMASP